MLQVRIHGRGGQGVVTGAELLSLAAFLDGKYAQAFPSFGSERMGAPVMAFCRIDTKTIRIREAVTKPDVLIIQDPTLLHQVDLFSGLTSSGYILINTTMVIGELGIDDVLKTIPTHHCVTIAATELAMKRLGRPLPNAVLVGSFAGLTGQLTLPSIQQAIRDKFPGAVGEANVAAASEGYETVVSHVAVV